MAISFVVEDGTGLMDSNSYVDLDYANTYHTNHGNLDWTAITDTEILKANLIQATQAIDLLYGQEFYSLPMSSRHAYVNTTTPYLQSLLWPRYTLVINNIQVIQTGVIPVQLKNAVSEVALMSLNGTDIFPQPNLLKYTTNAKIKVGDIAKDTTYGRIPDAERYYGFWKVEKILYPLLKRTSNPSFLSL